MKNTNHIMKAILTALCIIVLVGCTKVSIEPVDVSGMKDLHSYVGQMVLVRGEVTNTKCPYINGIDMWELEEHRGDLVEVTGILESWIVTEEDIQRKEQELGGPFAHRGPGTFFRLKDMKYKVIKKQL